MSAASTSKASSVAVATVLVQPAAASPGSGGQHGVEKKRQLQQGQQSRRSKMPLHGLSSERTDATHMIRSVASVLSRMRRSADGLLVVGLIGLALLVLQRELFYAYGDKGGWFAVIHTLRAVTTASTLVLFKLLFNFYQASFEQSQLNRVYLMKSRCWPTPKILLFLLECCVLAVHEPPGVNHDVRAVV
jgi:hypothetical protein